MEACFSNIVCCSYRVPLSVLCLDKIRQADARQFLPDALIGYDAEIEKRYHANPVTFHQEVAAARRQPAAAPAAEPTEPAQEPESKPLYT